MPTLQAKPRYSDTALFNWQYSNRCANKYEFVHFQTEMKLTAGLDGDWKRCKTALESCNERFAEREKKVDELGGLQAAAMEESVW